MKSIFCISILATLIILIGCERKDLGQAPVPDNYLQTINDWKEYRIGVLTSPTDWLRLTGIYWLNEGENTFGSGVGEDIRFPEGKIQKHAGIFILENGQVTMKVADGITITHEGEPVKEMVIFDGENRPHLQHGDLEWFIDSRGDKHGVRLYNKDNSKADAFAGFPAYPVDPKWHLKANFIPNPDSTSITLDNVLGRTNQEYSPGKIEFEIDGKTYTLDAFEGRTGLFIIVADETNKTETYQAGRYMTIPWPDENNKTIIDFNKTYNPPCAFSSLTTCQLPPPQNRLDIAITAGEKRPVEWEGL